MNGFTRSPYVRCPWHKVMSQEKHIDFQYLLSKYVDMSLYRYISTIDPARSGRKVWIALF
ncbi:MAG: hypothetical protein ACI9SC_003360 [Gammaproteobacteria bacterium]|jgi:hypothetical protein